MKILIEKILPNPEQPRVDFDPDELDALARSIHEHGVIQPIVVEQAENEMYILHDGERRLRAAKMAGLTMIPAHIVSGLNGAGSRERLLRAMVANVQRADLNAIEEARAYQKMRSDFGMAVRAIARTLGVSDARVMCRLVLLGLDVPIQELVAQGRLSKDAQVAEALLTVQDSAVRIGLAQRAAERKMSIKGIVEACKRVNQHVAESTGGSNANEAVAVRIATRLKPLNRVKWDCLAQIGKLPPWLLLELSARKVCQRCSLYEIASQAVCKECPLVWALETMLGKAANDDERS